MNYYKNSRQKIKKNIIKLKIKFELDKDSMKSITKLSTPKNIPNLYNC